MSCFSVHSIGEVCINEEETFIKVDKTYIPALQGLEGFSHINVIWYFSGCDDEKSRSVLEMEQPNKGAPDIMGTFATRSPLRPNPIALTTAEIIYIDFDQGIIQVAFIDADNNTPVLDIKPYTPSFDRVESPEVPTWCGGWPKSMEESGAFEWGDVFNF